jgi:hypothetical protein
MSLRVVLLNTRGMQILGSLGLGLGLDCSSFWKMFAGLAKVLAKLSELSEFGIVEAIADLFVLIETLM